MHHTDEHPEAVRSDPVPVPPPDDDRIPHQVDADHAADNRADWDGAPVNDADRDGVPDAVDPDARTAYAVDGDAANVDADRDGVPDASDPDAVSTDAHVGPTDTDRDGDTDRAGDTDRDGVPDTMEPDAGSTHDRDAMPGHADDADAALADRGTFDDPVVADDADRVPEAADATDSQVGTADTDRDADLYTVPAGADADRDGVPDTVDAEYADRSGNPDPDAVVQDGGTFDDPVVASPVEVDADRAEPYTEPGFAETALGGAAAGAAAGAAVGMAGNRRDGDTVVQDAPAEMKPGDAEADPVVTLMSADSAQGFRDRWRDVQLRFVDDPRGAATEAQSLAEEAVEALVAAISNHKNDLGGWQTTEAGDTEQLRVVVRRYRDLLDRVLGS